MLSEFGPWACHLAGAQHLLERPGREAKVGDQHFDSSWRHVNLLRKYVQNT